MRLEEELLRSGFSEGIVTVRFCSSLGLALATVDLELETRKLLGPTDLSGVCIHEAGLERCATSVGA